MFRSTILMLMFVGGFVRTRTIHTPFYASGETTSYSGRISTLSPGETTPGEQDIGRNDMLPSCQSCLRKKPFFGDDRCLYGDLVHGESPEGLFLESKTRLGRTAREKSIFSRSEARATALSEDSFLAKVGSRLQRAYPSAQD